MTELSTAERADKRERIIRAALKLFYQKGYNPISLEEIAREAGLGKGTLYLYFQDKEDLFASSVRHVIAVLEAAFNSAVDGPQEPFQVLERIALVQLETFARNREFFGLFFIISNPNLVSNRQELFSLVMHNQVRLMRYLAGVIRKAQEQGAIKRELDTVEIAHLFTGMLSNAIRRIGFQKPAGVKLDIEPTIRILMDVFRDGVVPRSDGRR